MTREAWRDKMCSQVKFGPDREAIWSEFYNHLEDKKEALVASGLSAQAAEERAVAALGDPEEVGRQMNGIHKPLLSWLWKLSGWLLALALVAALWSIAAKERELQSYPELNYYAAYLDENANRFWHTQLAGKRCVLRAVEPGTEGCWKRYTFQMQDAAAWDEGGNVTLYGHLTVSGFLPGEGALNLDRVYAVDDRGNSYGYRWEIINREDKMSDPPPWVYFIKSHRNGSAWEYVVELHQLDPDARWVEFRCDWAGQDLAFRVELTGGEGQ